MQDRESQIESDAPCVEPDQRHVVVRYGGEVIADTRGAVTVTEAGHPPAFYIPPEDVRVELLVANDRQTHCPLKGDAHYYDIVVDGTTAEGAAWCYPEPNPGFEAIKSAIAFYPARVDASVDGRPATPEENPYYGGWVIEE